MNTRLDELNKMLDELDQAIMEKYPEIEHEELHYAIARKVKLEIERNNLIKKNKLKISRDLDIIDNVTTHQ